MEFVWRGIIYSDWKRSLVSKLNVSHQESSISCRITLRGSSTVLRGFTFEVPSAARSLREKKSIVRKLDCCENRF
jgi:hypothetical protein